MERPDDPAPRDTGSWLNELSVVTRIVSVAVIAAIVVYAMLIAISLFS